MVRGFVLLFISLTVSQSLWAADACDLSGGPRRNLMSMGKLVDEVEESPFIVACKEPGLLKGRPKTAILSRTVVKKDSKGRTTRDFLSSVIAKARKRIQITQEQMRSIHNCLDKKTPECEEQNNFVQKEVPEFVKDARYNLSLAQSQHEFKSWISIASQKVNKDLDDLGSYKLKDWAPLTDAENKRAQEQLNIYRSQISAETKARFEGQKLCISCQSQFREDALFSVRFQNFQTYHQMIAEVPLLQYLKGPEVSTADLRTAFTEMDKDLSKEEQQLNEYEKMLAGTGDIPTDALKVMNYATEVEETLLEDEGYCGLGAALVFSRSNRQIEAALAMGLPILAASIFAAPVVLAVGGTALAATATSIGVGVAGGAGFTLHSYERFKETQQRTMGHIYGDDLKQDLVDLESSEQQLKYDAVTMPIGFGLGGVATRSATVGAKALLSGRKVFKQSN